jgi:hypothetical protein
MDDNSNILNKQLRTVDRRWSSSLRAAKGQQDFTIKPSIGHYKMLHRALEFGGFFWQDSTGIG